MNFLSLVSALALLVQGVGHSFLDERIGDYDKKAPPGMADLTVGQLMTFTALPKARVVEALCAGFMLSTKYEGPVAVPRKTELKSAVIAAIANDSRLGETAAGHFLTMMIAAGEEDPPKKAECSDFIAMAEADAPLVISPLLNTAAVDPRLATCHARYAIAAEKADAASRDSLSKDAERARVAALAGKSGQALIDADVALAEAVAAERAGGSNLDEQEVMGLVMCQPLMARNLK